MFAHLQKEFATALLDAGQPVPASLRAYNADVPYRRFAVYRNNVTVGLVEAVRAGFPAVERIVGDEFFAAMARCYVVAHPPRSPLLLEFGDDFPDFIAGFAPAAEMTYLADVARLEFARRRAYHAADADALSPARFAEIGAERLSDMRLALHPATQVLRSSHPVFTVWQMNCGAAEPAPVDEVAPEDVLVTRAGLDVVTRKLPNGAAAFVQALDAGRPLGEAADRALREARDFDLAGGLALLIGLDTIIGFSFL